MKNHDSRSWVDAAEMVTDAAWLVILEYGLVPFFEDAKDILSSRTPTGTAETQIKQERAAMSSIQSPIRTRVAEDTSNVANKGFEVIISCLHVARSACRSTSAVSNGQDLQWYLKQQLNYTVARLNRIAEGKEDETSGHHSTPSDLDSDASDTGNISDGESVTSKSSAAGHSIFSNPYSSHNTSSSSLCEPDSRC
jgi:hypothetical protein